MAWTMCVSPVKLSVNQRLVLLHNLRVMVFVWEEVPVEGQPPPVTY